MRTTPLLALTLSAVLIAPGTAWAGPNGDPVCATDGTNCQPQPESHPDPVCATDGTNCQPSTHVVKRGEWLWKIARERLAAAGKPTAPSNVRKIADMIYADNRRVIGRNKNRLRVGQRLTIRVTEQWPV